jgi:hypothetical protein
MKGKWILLAGSIMLFGAGCTTTRLQQGGAAALDLAAKARPEYAVAIKEIKGLLGGGTAVNPVDGFQYTVIWTYKGVQVDKADIAWEEVYRRVGTPAVGGAATQQPAQASTNDAALREQIAAIIDAAGVVNE